MRPHKYNVRHWVFRIHSMPGAQPRLHEPFLKEAIAAGVPSLMITSGRIQIHVDAEEQPCYLYHAVLLNDGFVAKGPKQPFRHVPKQEPGTMFLLNIHEPHHLIRDMRTPVLREHSSYPGWVSLCFGSDTILSWEEVERRFSEPLPDLERLEKHKTL